MKLRLEPQKTTLRLSKEELQALIDDGIIEQKTVLPNGYTLFVKTDLGSKEDLSFDQKTFHVTLPCEHIKEYKPNKVGLSFIFEMDGNTQHTLVFEVDIKRPPLGSKK